LTPIKLKKRAVSACFGRCICSIPIDRSHAVEQIDQMPCSENRLTECASGNRKPAFKAAYPHFANICRTIDFFLSREKSLSKAIQATRKNRRQHGLTYFAVLPATLPLVFVPTSLSSSLSSNHNGYIKSLPSGY
jgi:hypothetical protein